MDRYIVVSSDGHAGPPAELYRDYLDPEFRSRFDEHQETMTAFRASMETESSKRFVEEWEEETGGDGGLTAGYDSAARNADPRHARASAPRCCSRTPTCSAPGGWRRRRSAPASPPDRRAIPPTPSPGAAPTTGGSPTSSTEEPDPPHRHRGDPRDHPGHGPRAPARARGQGPGSPRHPHPDPLVRPARRTTSRTTTRCSRWSRSWASCSTPTRAPGPADYGMGYGMLPIYASEAGWWAARPLHVLIWAGVFERYPDAPVLDGRERRLVGARRDPEDGREVGGRPQHPQVRRRVPRRRSPMKPSEYLDRNCFFGVSTPGVDDIERRHLIGVGNMMWGNDLPHPEGTYPYTRLLDPRAVPRRVGGGDPAHPGPHRRRGVRPRRRRAPCEGGQDRSDLRRGPRRHGGRPGADRRLTRHFETRGSQWRI